MSAPTANERRAIAAELGLSDPYLYQCITGRKAMKAKEEVAIERLSGGRITRRHLRPKDWWQVWPELVTEEHPIPQDQEVA